MEYLFENPIPLVMVGLVILTFCGVVYYTSRSTPALVATVLVAALVVSLLVLEQLVETPREGVVTTLRAAATAAEANDLERVLSFVAGEDSDAHALISEVMPQFDVTTVNVGREVDIVLDDERDPRRASARFMGFFHGRHKRSGAVAGPRGTVSVELVRKGQVWAIEKIDLEGPWREELNSLRR